MAETHYDKAEKLKDTKKYKEAIDEYKLSLKERRGYNSLIYKKIAEVYIKLNNLETAQHYYDKYSAVCRYGLSDIISAFLGC